MVPIEEALDDMETTFILCDYAEAINGKLYIMGGGWTVCPPGPRSQSLAIKVLVPWDKANEKHQLKVILQDSDGHTVSLGEPPNPVVVDSQFEVGRPPNITKGTPLDFVLALGFMGLPLELDTAYQWQIEINGVAKNHVAFRTMASL